MGKSIVASQRGARLKSAFALSASVLALLSLDGGRAAFATDYPVSTTTDFTNAIASSTVGDRILLQNGIAYGPGFGLSGASFDTNSYALGLSGGIGNGSGNSLTKLGTGTLTLSGTNNFTGGTTITAGTLAVGSDANLGATSGGLTFNGGDLKLTSSFDLAGTRNITATGGAFTPGGGPYIKLDTNGFDLGISRNISGNIGLEKYGAGTLRLRGTNTYNGLTIVRGGTLNVTSTGNIGADSKIDIGGGVLQFGSSFTLSSNQTIGVGNGTIDTNGFNASLAASIDGTPGTFVKTGSGTLTLLQDAAFSVISGGVLRVEQGTLQLGNGGAAGSYGNLRAFVDGALVFNRSDTLEITRPITGTGTITQAGSGRTITTSDVQVSAINILSGTLELRANTLNGSILNNSALVMAAASMNYADSISGTGSVAFLCPSCSGGGMAFYTLTGNNTYSGGTTIGSTVRVTVGNDGSTGMIGGNVANAGALTFVRSGTVIFSGNISGSGTVAHTGNGTLILTGNNSYTNTTIIGSSFLNPASKLQIGDGGTTGSLASNIDMVLNSSLAFNRSDTVTYSGIISGSGPVSQIGSGTLVLTGAHTYAGVTTISGGALQLGNGGTSGSLAGPSFSNSMVNNGTLIFNRSDDFTFSQSISGTGALIKRGAGTVTMFFGNAATGPITISEGGLNFSVAPGSSSIANNGVLTFTAGGTYAGTISGAGSLIKQGASQIILTGDSSAFAGGTTISTGAMSIGNGGTTGALGGNIVNNGTLNFNRAGTLVHAGDISGSGALNKLGTGTVVLTGADTRTGATTISGGILQIGNGGTTGSLAAGSVSVASGTRLVINRSDNVTFANALSGSGAFTKAGSGAVVFSGARTYTGGTTISGGVLQVSADNNLGSASGGINLDGGALQFAAAFDLSATRAMTITAASGINTNSFDIVLSNTLSGAGDLAKSGTGTLTLTGDTSGYTGTTTVAAGTLSIGNGGTTGALAGNIVNNGTLIFNRSDAVTYAGSITGTGALSKTGTTALFLTGDSSGFTGTTTVSSSPLSIGNGGTSGALGGNIVNTNAVTFNRSNASSFAGVLSGNGVLTKSGAGTLTLTGNSTAFSGTTTIAAGTLSIGNGGTSGSLNGNIVDSGALIFNRSNDLAYAGVISGGGTLTKAGAGTLTLTGNSSGFTGTTTVTGGTLVVNGSLGGPVAASNGSQVKGSGTLGSYAAASGATVAPGNSIGTLTVAGNISFAPGSFYEVELDETGASDRINAGTATLTGGTVQVVGAPGAYINPTTYTILSTTGGVTGTFSGLTFNDLLFQGTLNYTPTAVTLTLVKSVYPDVAVSGNEVSVSNAIKTGGRGTALFSALLNFTTPQAVTAFNALSGEIYADLAQGVGAQFADAQDALSDGMRGSRPAGPSWSLWARASGNWSDVNGNANNAASSSDSTGATLGADGTLGAGVQAGVQGGFSSGTLKVDGRGSRAGITAGHMGGYAAGGIGDVSLRAGIFYGWGTAKTTRSVIFTGFSETARADQDANIVQLQGEAAYRINLSGVGLSPFVGVTWNQTSLGAFSETGGVAALSGGELTSAQSTVSFGADLAAPFDASGARVVPTLRFAWLHDVSADASARQLRFLSNSQGFTVAGLRAEQDRFSLNTDISLGLSSNLQLILGYRGEFSSSATTHGANGTLAWRF